MITLDSTNTKTSSNLSEDTGKKTGENQTNAPINPEQSKPNLTDHSKKMKICHVSMSLETGGLEKLLVEFGKRTNSDKFKLSYAVLDKIGPPGEELMSLGFDVKNITGQGFSKYWRIVKLMRHLDEQKIDIVHTHNTYAHFYGALAARLAGIPVIINTQHGRGCGPNFKSRVQFRIANTFSDRVLAVSDDAQELCANQDRWHHKKIETLWNGIDVERFKYHGPHSNGEAITVCRLSPEKDIATMLKAVQIVCAQKPDFKLTIVGDGAERTTLMALANELNINKHVTFLGERNDIPDLLKRASIYVGSSLTEGISLTLLEAMAVGMPIVTTDVGGNREVVKNDLTGKLVPPSNPQSLAEAILDMYQNQNQWEEMAIKSRERVEKHFSITRMINDYEKLYQTILQEKHTYQ